MRRLTIIFLMILVGILIFSADTIKIFMIPKFTGAPYFVATEKGAKKAVEELKALGLPIDFLYTGSSVANTEEEIRIISNLLEQNPDALIVSANDEDALVPVLKKAKQKGIVVVTYDADVSDPTARDYFVNQASFDAIGAVLIDLVAKNVKPDANIAIVSADPNAANQNRWIEAMKRRMKEKYPKMKLLTIKYGYDRPAESFQAAQDIINAYPNVDAIIAPTSVAFPMVAEAVVKAGLKGKIYVTGLATPNDMRKYVKMGVVQDVVLWNPVDLGYLSVYVANAAVRGMISKVDGTEYVCGGKLGLYKVYDELEGKKSVVLLGPPFIFTIDNIDQFNF
ncbi:MAG: autoinducer 2 ABC transporter substrate-binding protein [Thermotoga sp.]|nr:MAG: autoinducer 2 ABC transporter substrate-binding protein [Thermotoga sp.]HDM70818.1 autoinducer 2 ABC transporter substrate-binding protein [Thermotogales bacterium]